MARATHESAEPIRNQTAATRAEARGTAAQHGRFSLMTRENKLALVVGFGLILFVGILISDHFSTVRTQRPADLTTTPASLSDAMASVRVNDPNLIELQPFAPTAANTAVMTPQHPIVQDTARPEHVNNVLHGTLPPPPDANDDVRVTMSASIGSGSPAVPNGFVPVPERVSSPFVKRHEVKSGETLYSICRKYYGDVSRVKSLAAFNNMSDPAALTVGRHLQIPPAELIGGKPAPAKASPSTPGAAPQLKVVNQTTAVAKNTSARPSTYTVKSGDSLARIADKFLGSKAKWKKIYDLNRDVIDDPDDVKPGIVLKLL